MGTIAQKLEYLNDTRLLLKDNINKIKNVLDDNSTFRSYPQELFNGYLDVLNNGTDTLWSNLEKVSQTGTEAVLEGVETAPIKMVLNGNTSQDGEPTPDTPVEVKVVKGNNVVSVQGKNLFDVSTSVNGYINPNTGEVGGSTVTKTSDFIEANSNSTYSFSFDYDTISNTSYRTIAYYNSNKEIIGYNTYLVTNKEKTFETPNNTSYVRISYPTESYDIQLEEGSTATPYVPYSKTDYPINLGDIELCKINTYQDYFHKDSGKWYVHKEIEKVILDGTEEAQSYKYRDNYRFTIIPNKYRNNIYYSGETLNSMNNRIETSYKYTIANPSIAITPALFCHTSGVLITMTPKYNLSTIDDIKNWLSNNNVTLYYVLATPTEEEITNTTLIEQLEAISKAKSVKDKTYITQTNEELPFILDVEAIKEYEVD